MASYPAEFYAALHTGTPGDLEYYARACLGAKRVLELGCGYGRVLSALQKDDPGRRLVGIDIDEALLDRARANVAHSPNIELHQIDFHELALNERFDRILLPFCGLYCLENSEQLHALFARVRDHLEPRGRFILDAYSADHFHHLDDDENDEDDVEPHEHDPVLVRGVEYRVYEQSRADRSQQRICVSYLHSAIDAEHAARVGIADEVIAELMHRYFLRDEIVSAARDAGLNLVQEHGAFDENPRHEDSTWLIFQFERATDVLPSLPR